MNHQYQYQHTNPVQNACSDGFIELQLYLLITHNLHLVLKSSLLSHSSQNIQNNRHIPSFTVYHPPTRLVRRRHTPTLPIAPLARVPTAPTQCHGIDFSPSRGHADGVLDTDILPVLVIRVRPFESVVCCPSGVVNTLKHIQNTKHIPLASGGRESIVLNQIGSRRNCTMLTQLIVIGKATVAVHKGHRIVHPTQNNNNDTTVENSVSRIHAHILSNLARFTHAYRVLIRSTMPPPPLHSRQAYSYSHVM